MPIFISPFLLMLNMPRVCKVWKEILGKYQTKQCHIERLLSYCVWHITADRTKCTIRIPWEWLVLIITIILYWRCNKPSAKKLRKILENAKKKAFKLICSAFFITTDRMGSYGVYYMWQIWSSSEAAWTYEEILGKYQARDSNVIIFGTFLNSCFLNHAF